MYFIYIVESYVIFALGRRKIGREKEEKRL